MGALRQNATGRRILLETDHVVGRAPTCALRLLPRYVSGQHARLCWRNKRWDVRDLGSSNGTFVNGARITAGEPRHVERGSHIAFGNVDELWELVDDSPPAVMAVPIDGGDPVVMDGELLALPSREEPRVNIYRGPMNSWLLEQPDASVVPIANMQVFQAGGQAWRFCHPEDLSGTSFSSAATPMVISHLQVALSVSSNEEEVRLVVTCSGKSFDMGIRDRHYLLLTLARQRLKDAAAGLPVTACGWICQDDFSHDPSMMPAQLNLDVFRLRGQFAAIGVVDAAAIIERRPGTRQLRIGTDRIVIGVL
jgi:hypothetical protein